MGGEKALTPGALKQASITLPPPTLSVSLSYFCRSPVLTPSTMLFFFPILSLFFMSNFYFIFYLTTYRMEHSGHAYCPSHTMYSCPVLQVQAECCI